MTKTTQDGISFLRQCQRHFFPLSRVSVLAALSLALSLLFLTGAGDAQAWERDIFSAKHPLSEKEINAQTYRGIDFQNQSSAGEFTFKETTYSIRSVWSGKRDVRISINPAFPPEGEIKNRFKLYMDEYVFSFADATVSESGENTWPGSATRWSKADNGGVKITYLEDVGEIRAAEYPDTGSEHVVRLEIYNPQNRKWHWVCNTGFGKEEAKVACRQLGLPYENATAHMLPSDWREKLGERHNDENLTSEESMEFYMEWFHRIMPLAWFPALLDNIDCEGNEETLVDCEHSGWGVSVGCFIDPHSAAVDCSE